MIPNSLIELAAKPRRGERGSPELRAYARQEWHADIAWVLGRFSRERVRSPARRQRRERTPTVSASDRTPLRAGTEATPLGLPVAEDCPHAVVEDLGFGGPASFLRCALCGGVLILHAGRRWSIAPVEPVAWEETSDG